jgi:hypothetical protein
MVESFAAGLEAAAERPARARGPIEQEQVAADLEVRIAHVRVWLLESAAVPEQEPTRVIGRGALAERGVEVGLERVILIEVTDRRPVAHLEAGPRRELDEEQARVATRPPGSAFTSDVRMSLDRCAARSR